MEVIVTFLEGDPRPAPVTGCVYNGANIPYPSSPTRRPGAPSFNSSPGGGGYNEIRFEDLAGSEEVFLHAQKDFNEVVEHDHATVVHNDQRNTVDVNHWRASAATSRSPSSATARRPCRRRRPTLSTASATP